MKRILSIVSMMIIVLTIMSCRAATSVSTREHRQFTADTLATVSVSQSIDSASHYRTQIDTVYVQMDRFLQHVDGIYVKDSTIVTNNADGTTNTLRIRETNRVSLTLQREIESRVQSHYQHIIDSLTSIITDTAYTYTSSTDSVQNNDQTVVTKEPSFIDKLRAGVGLVLFLGLIAIILSFVYKWLRGK